ncbi:hypothetical protein [Vibrio metoecus]|uniref:hypothetical protein n=1 Tax=Vibrio metoecus TaxID=1481663 RepID=UPI000A5481F8
MSQIPEISVESTDLLTEIAVSYYQDGATQEEIFQKIRHFTRQSGAIAQTSP